MRTSCSHILLTYPCTLSVLGEDEGLSVRANQKSFPRNCGLYSSQKEEAEGGGKNEKPKR